MKIIVFAFTLFIFFESLSYYKEEYFKNKNKLGSFVVLCISTIGLFLPNFVLLLYY